MKNKKFILTAKYFNATKRDLSNCMFIGTVEEAHKKAQEICKDLLSAGYQFPRVEIWEVIATDYKGTVRS